MFLSDGSVQYCRYVWCGQVKIIYQDQVLLPLSEYYALLDGARSVVHGGTGVAVK